MNSTTMCRFTGAGTPDPFPAGPGSPSGGPATLSAPAAAVGANCSSPPVCQYQTGIIGGGNAIGVGSNLGIVIPGFSATQVGNQWYQNWVGAQNNQTTTYNFVQIGWQWINGQATDYVFVQEWLNGKEVYGNHFTQFPLNAGGVKTISMRLQTSGNNLYYPFIYWGGSWVNVGASFNVGFSATPYAEVIGEGSVQNGAPPPAIPTETNTGNIVIEAGTTNWTNWPWNVSQYAPPYCLYSSSPWTSFQTWNTGTNHC